MVLAVLLIALAAGLLGSLFGLGGGIIVIPALTLALGFGVKEAIGASLVGVIASSTGAASRYVHEGYANIKLGMLLETATTAGSIIGAFIAIYLDQFFLLLAFSIILVYSSLHMLVHKERMIAPDSAEAERELLDLSCQYVDPINGMQVCYGVKSIRTGMLASLGAGSLSGLLGIGGGVIKVPVMNTFMCVPMKAATATSNFMIGVTALASAVIYFRYGYIDPVLGALVAVGVIFGAMVGTRTVDKVQGKSLRKLFAVVLIAVAILMILKAFGMLEAL
ncbi:MAG: hypothetical protein A4E32_00446 [Methanomassiliicoccales archaeon PtaU1.Bin124]|nr:MAG: hypothetical protein A4E32_00446 [Methanomassiliicoccales archaeon PtaU1.Bin124]